MSLAQREEQPLGGAYRETERPKKGRLKSARSVTRPSGSGQGENRNPTAVYMTPLAAGPVANAERRVYGAMSTICF